MSIKGKQIGRLKNWVKKLEDELAVEKQKAIGYEELTRIHNAYIAILLHRLNATKEESVAITKEEVSHAMNHFEARAFSQDEGVWNFYCDEVE